jgi:hypothetical protein
LVLEECPFCHRLLAAEQISKEQVDSSIVAEQSASAGSGTGGVGLTGMLMLALEPGVSVEGVASNPEDFITYKLGYRCKHCGKQWTRLSVKAVEIPESYVKNEEEKTDYDADKEEEEPREEAYDEEE